MQRLYSIIIKLYGLGIKLASPFNDKAKKWVSGRQDWINSLKNIPDAQSVIWVHCASTGEYEQGKPIIKELKHKYPDSFILLSFFSSSGYESYTHNPGVDHICYLPLDTKKNAVLFIQTVNPSKAIFIKYEIWYHFLFQLEKKRIPTYLISARFYDGHYIFKPGMDFLRKRLRNLKAIFVQDQHSKNLLEKNNINNAIVSGDTRIDQVVGNSKHPFDRPWLKSIAQKRTCLIAGSTWPKGDQLLQELRKQIPNLLLIIAPHEFDQKKLSSLQGKFGPHTYIYSALKDGNIPAQVDTILIDEMGILKYLYRYADVAYIGGGFDAGLHNILEASIYGIPVIFGPHFRGNNEAEELIRLGVAHKITLSPDWSILFKTFKSNSALTSSLLHDYFLLHSRVSERIVKII